MTWYVAHPGRRYGHFEQPSNDSSKEEQTKMSMRKFLGLGLGLVLLLVLLVPLVAAQEAPRISEPVAGSFLQGTVTATVMATGTEAAPAATATTAATTAATGTTPAAATPQALPQTGGVNTPWTSVLLLVVGGLVAALGLGLAFARR
jgi:hypothetical protein